MKKKCAGYTMMEVLIVVICIGLLAAVAAGGFNRTIQVGRETAATGKARMVNAARATYGLTVPGAAATWTATTGGAARLQLLITAGVLDGTTASYLTPTTGYTIEVSGALRDRTVVKRGGTALTYND